MPTLYPTYLQLILHIYIVISKARISQLSPDARISGRSTNPRDFDTQPSVTIRKSCSASKHLKKLNVMPFLMDRDLPCQRTARASFCLVVLCVPIQRFPNNCSYIPHWTWNQIIQYISSPHRFSTHLLKTIIPLGGLMLTQEDFPASTSTVPPNKKQPNPPSLSWKPTSRLYPPQFFCQAVTWSSKLKVTLVDTSGRSQSLGSASASLSVSKSCEEPATEETPNGFPFKGWRLFTVFFWESNLGICCWNVVLTRKFVWKKKIKTNQAFHV